MNLLCNIDFPLDWNRKTQSLPLRNSSEQARKQLQKSIRRTQEKKLFFWSVAMGFKRWGLSKSEDMWRKRPVSSVFWLSRQRQKKGAKGRFRPISRKGDQTPLSPHLLHPHLRQPKCGHPNRKKYMRILFLRPELGIQYTYTYVQFLSTIDLELDTHTSRFSQGFAL